MTRINVLCLLLACLIVTLYMTNVGMTQEDASLVLYLTFDDAGEPKDLSPKGSPIASYIKPADVVEGIKDNAWAFDQSTCVLLDAQTFNDAFQKSTFSVWLKEPDKDGLIYEEGGSSHGFAVTLVKGAVQFATRSGGTQTTLSADYPDDNDWHFITAVFDKGMRLYIDGELMEEKPNVAGISGHSDEMGIGKENGASSGNVTPKFTGIMDEFRITRRGLTTEEVQKMYEDMIRTLAVRPSGKCSTTWGGIKE